MGCHFLIQCMKVKSESEVAQSCLTLSDPMDCSLPVFSAHGIFQARVLEWVAIAFSDFRPHWSSFLHLPSQMKTVPLPGLFEGVIKGGNVITREELNLDVLQPETSCLKLSSALLPN